MTENERRGVSIGTVFMLLMTLCVLVGCSIVFPRLMGSANIRMDDRAMQSSTNLNDSLPELSLSEIPIAPSVTPVVSQPVMEVQPTPEVTMEPPEVPAESPPAPIEPQINGTVTLTFAGSVCMDDLTRKSGYYSDSEKYDFTDNLALIADELSSDCTLLTLESITDTTGNVRQVPNAPDEVMDMLAAAHVNIVALGWNRAMDRGSEGAAETIRQASSRGMETLGLYDSQDDADRIRLIEIGEVKVAYLHYSTAITTTGKRQMNADDASYALPIITIGDSGVETISADINRAHQAGAHIVVVSINWSGSDTINTTSTKMKKFTQGLADAGADVIIGAGTKAVREVSWIMGKREDGSTHQTLCAWSLGSLLNGERGNGNVTGMLLHVQLNVTNGSVNFARVTYTPTYIWRYKQDDYYRYRVVASDLPAPGGMDESQAGNAARAFENLKKTLGNSPVTLRVK